MSSHRVETASTPISARVRPPGSKSETIRALAAAGLAPGRSHLYGSLHAEDTTAMAGALQSLGASVDRTVEPWAVDGTGGRLHAPQDPLDAAESGLTARFSMVLACFAEGPTTITGRGRLLHRPVRPLIDALGSQGVEIEDSDGYLPVTVHGVGGLWGGRIEIDCTLSSQFASALLLGAPITTEPTTLRIVGLEGSAGYLDVTVRVMEAFGATVTPTLAGYEVSNDGYAPADYLIEPDASAAVYPMGAAAITAGEVVIEGLTLDSLQPDILLARRLQEMGCRVEQSAEGLVVVGPEELRPIDTDMSAAPDGALALAAVCVFASGESRIGGLASLRHKESDRLEAITEELSRIGAGAVIDGDAIVISPGELSSAEIDPHGDHRIAMSVALCGLRVPGIVITTPEVVAKTWPGYWGMLADLTDAQRS